MKGLKKSLSQRGKSLLEMIQIQKDKEKSKILDYIQIKHSCMIKKNKKAP